MKKTIQVMMIEDHPEFREIIEFAIGEEVDIELVGLYGNAEHALRQLQGEKTSKIVDVVLLDLNLPVMSGHEAMPWIKKYSPDTKVIILSQSNMETDVLQAIKQGAVGYLLKSSTMDEIIKGIRTVMNGGAILDKGLALFIINSLRDIPCKEKYKSSITKREKEVLILIADGLSQKEISHELKIRPCTVTAHVQSVYKKLDVPNAPSAISKAFKAGILRPI
ncbi:MAG: response regulator transcription factor [Pontiella sp.]